MKKLIVALCILVILPSCFQSDDSTSYKDVNKFKSLAKKLYVDFDTSMEKQKYHHKIKNSEQLFKFLMYRYEGNSFKIVSPQQETKIPKLFHYIWLGKKLPDQYTPFLDTWLKNHPDWTFVFWVDNPENYYLGQLQQDFNFSDLEEYLKDHKHSKRIVIDVKNLTFDNRAFFDTTKNYGQRSDILRWDVVYRFGGVYIDVDFESIKPLDMLHHMYDFYTGIQPLDTNMVQLGAALFAARPGHPILEHCVKTIQEDWHKKQIVVSTGPIHFTKSFCAVIDKHRTTAVALPASYFYPCGYEEQKLPRSAWISPESFAVHHWAGSWLKPEGWDYSHT